MSITKIKMPAIIGSIWLLLLIFVGWLNHIRFQLEIFMALLAFMMLASFFLSFVFVIWSLIIGVISIKEKNYLWAVINFAFALLIIVIFIYVAGSFDNFIS